MGMRAGMRGTDLHTHSVHSDGMTTPAENVALAAEAGLAGLALSDHDTLAGWDEAQAACIRHGLEFIPGVELSTELDEVSIHLLGYWVDPHDEALLVECDRLRSERRRRAAAIVDRLAELGLPVRFADVEARAGSAPIGRPHIAAAMVAAGHVPDMDTAFTAYIADGGPAHVPKYALSPESGTALIRAAGGVAVLAHPGLDGRDARIDLALLERLTEAGLGGVEAHHAGHDESARDYWERAAQQRHLVVTGGSDFHGLRTECTIGMSVTRPDALDALRALATGVTSARGPASGDEEAARW